MIISLFYFVGVYRFYIKRNHLLNILLSLEFIRIIIYISLFCLIWVRLEKFILVYFLTFCVCEGAFGISILVRLVRSFGNDYTQRMTFLKC